MNQEPSIHRTDKHAGMPSAEWMKWYREKTGCSLSASLQAGQEKLRELEDHAMNAQLQRAQAEHDARIPEFDSTATEYLRDQVAQLLKGNDADNVLFFTKTRPQLVQGFADAVMELLGEIGGRECPVVQILIAMEQDKPDLASAIYHSRLREHIVALAEQIIQERAA